MPLSRSQLTALVFTLVMLAAVVWAGARRSVPIAQLEREPITFRVDVNHANVDTLSLLPEVGPSIARSLIAHREVVGPFATSDDLEAVSGIGPKVGPFATSDDLEAVSGIGPKTRAAIEPWIAFHE